MPCTLIDSLSTADCPTCCRRAPPLHYPTLPLAVPLAPYLTHTNIRSRSLQLVAKDYVILDDGIGANLPRSPRSSDRTASQASSPAATQSSRNIADTSGHLSIAWRNQTRFDQDLAIQEGSFVSALDCSYNQLYSFGFLKHFPNLTLLVLDHNHIDTLKLPVLHNLSTLWLNHNEIADIRSLLKMLTVQTPRLQHLSLLGNKGVPSYLNGGTQLEYIQYRLFVAGELPGLLSLDCSEFSADERSDAEAIASGANNHSQSNPIDAQRQAVDAHDASPRAATKTVAPVAAPRAARRSRPTPQPRARRNRATGTAGPSPVASSECLSAPTVVVRTDVDSESGSTDTTTSSEASEDEEERVTSTFQWSAHSKGVRLNLIADSDDAASVHSPEGSLFGDDSSDDADVDAAPPPSTDIPLRLSPPCGGGEAAQQRASRTAERGINAGGVVERQRNSGCMGDPCKDTDEIHGQVRAPDPESIDFPGNDVVGQPTPSTEKLTTVPRAAPSHLGGTLPTWLDRLGQDDSDSDGGPEDEWDTDESDDT
eukprot:m.154992 g.154992  ORF g.154992 m.154992 type:complete len:538 (-) comp17921_c0_seq5:63-1676(-)